MFVMRQLVNAANVSLDSLETSVNHSASVAIVQMETYVRRQLVNAEYVNLDSMEISVNHSASVTIVQMKQHVRRQLVNAEYVNLDLVDTSAQVNKDFSWKQGPQQLLQDTSVNFSPMSPKFVGNYPHKVENQGITMAALFL